MTKIFLSAVALCLGVFNGPAFAQEEHKKENKETEEVIIRKNGDKEMKLTVEINGDNITVNGKPLSEFKDDQVTINKKKVIIRDGDNMAFMDLCEECEPFKLDEDFMDQWKEEKESSKPFLGVTTDKVSAGVKILEVVKGSAAEKAGLKKEDIITKIGDEKIDDPETLADIIAAKKPKDEIKIYYNRNGKSASLKAILGEHKYKRSMAYAFGGKPGMVRSFRVPTPPVPPMEGLEELESMNDMPGMQNQFDGMLFPKQKKIGIKIQDMEDSNNVKVIEVEAGSAAEKAGLKKEDIITEIDGKAINNTDEARQQLHPEEGKTTYSIKIKRNGTAMAFDVKIPKKVKTANL